MPELPQRGGTTCVRLLVLGEDNPLRDKLDTSIIEAFENCDCETTYRKARLLAEQGDAGAQVFLGTLFQDGWGIPVSDYDEAVKWYQRASDQGHPVAQLLLANRYRDGHGELCEDLDKMLELYYKSANQNYAEAYYALAANFCFSSEKNHIEAYKWAKLAAAHLKLTGHKELMEWVIESLENLLSSAELAEAERLISEWKPNNDLSLDVE